MPLYIILFYFLVPASPRASESAIKKILSVGPFRVRDINVRRILLAVRTQLSPGPQIVAVDRLL